MSRQGPGMGAPADDGWLDRLRQAGALLDGHFRLSSGLHSPHYMQCARLLERPPEAEAAGQALVERLASRVDAAPGLVASPAIGGIVLGHEVARAWGARAIWAERSADGALALRRGFEAPAGERVVAVEDVVTTAGSLRELIAVVEREGARVVAVASLVDRSGGRIAWPVPSASLVRLEGVQYAPAECPLCAAGIAVASPGSRCSSPSS